ncbi:MAG: hypothetical protein LBJ59_11535 [Zoogloeaceae bacterium]|jgi:hypothetical protein|nr:hypothetical protein [Zoogloeaceae bacterium]
MARLRSLMARLRRKPEDRAQAPRREPGVDAPSEIPAPPSAEPAARALSKAEKAMRRGEKAVLIGKKLRVVGKAALVRLIRALSPALTLLVWDVGVLSGVVARKSGRSWRFSAIAVSSVSDFARALDEVLAQLKQAGEKPPKTTLLAARAIAPARVDLPVNPEKPRPLLQMREMTRSEMEPVAAEFGALWNIGAVLAAHNLITPEERERVALELAVRRNETDAPNESRKPFYFGQVACEMGLVTQEALEDALRLQEKLQMLESWLACGWTGYAGEPGEPPIWLASATGLSLWSQCEAAAKSRGLKLKGGLPLAWSVSEALDETSGEAPGHIALEIHSESIVAVLRYQGRVHSSRNESRMERALSADLLINLVSDWRAGGVHDLEIVCVNPRDDALVAALLDDLGQRWGHAPRFRAADATRQDLFATLARQHRNTRAKLPIIRFGNLPQAIWKKTGFWHLVAPLLTLAAVSGIAAHQYMEIKKVRMRFAQEDIASQQNTQAQQELRRVLAAAQTPPKELARARARLAQIAPEVERLETVEGMIDHLPQLLRALAANIGDDVVLEALHHSPNPNDIGNIQIIAWSNNYSSVQSFAQDLQQTLIGMGYTVAQTDVKAAPGRDKSPGYTVSFWLIPVGGQEELGEPSVEAGNGPAGGGTP